ncbi:MAG: hypothetical protein ABSE68_02160 [Minisyncoccia bacterium]
MKSINELDINSNEEDILEFCKDNTKYIPDTSKRHEVLMAYGLNLLNIKQQKALVEDQRDSIKDQKNSSEKLIRTNKYLVIATIALLIGTIFSSIFSSWYQVKSTKNQESTNLMISFSNDLRSERNSALVYAIGTNQKPLLQINHGQFSDEQLDNYLMKYELIYSAYQSGLINKEIIKTAFDYDLMEAYKNSEVQKFIKDVGPDKYPGFITLSKLVIAN